MVTLMKSGTLFVVATPIGNLEDISSRAIKTLKEVDLVAAEDTRRASILFKANDISPKVTSYHSHNLKRKTPSLIKELKGGVSIAVISDSGTPGISDPGSVLVAECVKNDIDITTIPGPAALISALVLSGKPTNKFVFEGFLSNKKARRRRQLKDLAAEKRTVIVYESPHRILKFLADFNEIFGDKEIIVAREITKKFEQVLRGNAASHIQHFTEHKPRGEFVLVF
ncbi:MAG: 16S rRNA (cytidine(1402)-2'-O)-methyltransferase [Candidatus Aadella gelida]|nr:16S rRNA (cytidine(1402)-2'-O)-methyltransferase [Candidatus Aadella gelida]